MHCKCHIGHYIYILKPSQSCTIKHFVVTEHGDSILKTRQQQGSVNGALLV